MSFSRRYLFKSAIYGMLSARISASASAQTPWTLGADTVYKSSQSAPPDAYPSGSKFAYYGSENPWDRRFFDFGDGSMRIYHRRGPALMLAIVEGRVDEARRHAHAFLNEMPDDLEAMFALCVAAAAERNEPEALAWALKAIQAGLPASRFIAGPRDLLERVTAAPEFLKAAGGSIDILLHGPLIGDIAPRKAGFWLRTSRATNCTLHVSPRADFGDARSATGRTGPEEDFVFKACVDRLKPATHYHYGVSFDGAPIRNLGRFTTPPSARSKAPLRIGFGGCAGYAPWHERIWNCIAAENFNVFLLMGDNVYISLPGEPNAVHDYAYYQRQSRPEFRRMTASTPVLTIWDDHDAGMDDLWLGPYVDLPSWKMPLFRHFERQWMNGETGAVGAPGCWRTARIGAAEVFLLDGRTYRTNPFAPERTMLGPAQKRWLLARLKKSDALFKIIASPVAWEDRAKTGTNDGWSGFPEEREEIFDFIAKHQIDGVIALSSDRHRGDVWKHEREGAYPVWEFASALLTHDFRHELKPEAVFSYNASCHYVAIDIDPTPSNPTLAVKYITIDGEIVFEKSVALKDISF